MFGFLAREISIDRRPEIRLLNDASFLFSFLPGSPSLELSFDALTRLSQLFLLETYLFFNLNRSIVSEKYI